MDFTARHIGPSEPEQASMLKVLGFRSVDDLISKAVPESIRTKAPLKFPGAEGAGEREVLERLQRIAKKNVVARSFIGMGYYGTHTPAPIRRMILENPAWYTAYTPYQPEISQGRLEALLNFQTVVTDLTGLPVANASLLDEATAAAEAMAICAAHKSGSPRKIFHVSTECHPQTIAVVLTRAKPLGIEVELGDLGKAAFTADSIGALFQYPGTSGHVENLEASIQRVHAAGALAVVATDLLALTILCAPGDFGADIALGSSQRFGVPFGFGGPHAAFFAVKDELKRLMPGRIVGVSKDNAGNPALRLALQTREQHIRREKATSNICTSQVLLAVMSGMYAVYHGGYGLQKIARRVNVKAQRFAATLKENGFSLFTESVFDTVSFQVSKAQGEEILHRALGAGILLRILGVNGISVSFDELTSEEDLQLLAKVIIGKQAKVAEKGAKLASNLLRNSPILQHSVFEAHRSEQAFVRYAKRLELKDYSLVNGMIPLGSCTMKLNAAAEMLPVTWPEFANIHPFAPAEHAAGYGELFLELEEVLKSVTGFAAVSLQPNAGSQGEYAGLLAIRGYHESRGETRRVCLIPKSAHGTNPASAVMAGFTVVPVECDSDGNVELADLMTKAGAAGNNLAACMVTFPSTHGVFEETIKDIASVVHSFGGQVYLDGANMNALVGVIRPAELGADVCHINLHKTFCIPHGGGGPGVGPIAVAAHLAPFLPGHPALAVEGKVSGGPVSAAPWGSASILPISWCYSQLMGARGLTDATKIAILSANYLAAKLEGHYPVLYRGRSGYVAHECIFDLRAFKAVGIEVEDVAKRLMDYGFHAPTVSFPVPGTIMVEPTESEPKAELDRFIEAMIAIRGEISAVEKGLNVVESPLKHAPHTQAAVLSSEWSRPYSREVAAFPTAHTREAKFWPTVGRIDGVFGDRNLICSCSGFGE